MKEADLRSDLVWVWPCMGLFALWIKWIVKCCIPPLKVDINVPTRLQRDCAPQIDSKAEQ